jgi:hypothetical protein
LPYSSAHNGNSLLDLLALVVQLRIEKMTIPQPSIHSNLANICRKEPAGSL